MNYPELLPRRLLARWQLRSTALVAVLALSACGGSSERDSKAVVSQAVADVVVPAATEPGAPQLSNNIPADGMAWINYRRAQLGVPVLTQNTLVDRAAQGHSDYLKTNNTVSHEQTTGKPGFTGVLTQDRLIAAGYGFGANGYAGEVISATSSKSGFYMAEELITAIYHRFAIFEPKFREIGTGAATTPAGYTYFTSNFAASNTTGAGLGRAQMAHWPYSDQKLVPTNFFSDNETPDPVSNANEVGYPISVHADTGSTMKVTAFTLRERGATSDLNVKLLSPQGDEHTGSSVAAIVPLAVLRANTVYDVVFRGSVDGVAADRSWSFTTR